MMNDNVNDEERVRQLNKEAVLHLQEWLRQLDEGEATNDDLLASLYGSLVVASALGYNIQVMAKDAKKGADKLAEMLRKDSYEGDE